MLIIINVILRQLSRQFNECLFSDPVFFTLLIVYNAYIKLTSTQVQSLKNFIFNNNRQLSRAALASTLHVSYIYVLGIH